MSKLDDDRRQEHPTHRLGTCLLILCGLIALLSVVIVVALVQRREARISRANYSLLRTGMSEADIRRLLGPPNVSMMQFGQVSAEEGLGAYAMNVTPTAALRSRGYDDYRFMQWTSPDTVIIVICDKRGSLATRYQRRGGPMAWYVRVMLVFESPP